jgi:hypothetical protein
MTTEQPQCTCTSNKGTLKSAFPSQYAAEMWFALKQKENGWTEPQRAYKCPQSSLWHLTTDTEARPAIPVAKVNYKQAEATARITISERVRRLKAAEPHLTVKEIAARIGCKPQNVYHVFSKNRKQADAVPAPAKSLSGIADRKKQLAEEMTKLEAAEKQLREELLPKVQVFGNNGDTQVRITCNNQSLIMALEAVAVLKSQLAEVR